MLFFVCSIVWYFCFLVLFFFFNLSFGFFSLYVCLDSLIYRHCTYYCFHIHIGHAVCFFLFTVLVRTIRSSKMITKMLFSPHNTEFLATMSMSFVLVSDFFLPRNIHIPITFSHTFLFRVRGFARYLSFVFVSRFGRFVQHTFEVEMIFLHIVFFYIYQLIQYA